MPDLEHITLTPGDPSSFLTDRKIKDDYNHEYFPDSQKITRTITKNTVFWYPREHFKIYPPDLYAPPEHEGKEIAGIFLKGVLANPEKQQRAWEGLESLDWLPPKRPETRTAVKIQKGNLVTPRELSIGWTKFALKGKKGHRITLTKETIANKERLEGVGALVQEMDHCFARALPFYARLQNQRKWDPEVRKLLADPGWVNSSNFLRLWVTSYSASTLLRSCPASIHKDRNANLDQTNFACLTSVGKLKENGEPEFSGGSFCLIEYGIRIPINPGDIFIGQTTREWHCNLDPVVGTKYSVICYYHPRAAKPGLKIHEPRRKPAKKKH